MCLFSSFLGGFFVEEKKHLFKLCFDFLCERKQPGIQHRIDLMDLEKKNVCIA